MIVDLVHCYEIKLLTGRTMNNEQCTIYSESLGNYPSGRNYTCSTETIHTPLFSRDRTGLTDRFARELDASAKRKTLLVGPRRGWGHRKIEGL